MDKFDKIKDACEEETLNFDEICRLCLKWNSEMRSIFDDFTADNDWEHRKLFIKNIKEMIVSFATIDIIRDDGLPSLICSDCMKNTQKSFEFKKQCEISDYRLRNYLTKTLETKHNVLESVSKKRKTKSSHKKSVNFSKQENCEQMNNEGTTESSQQLFPCTECSANFTQEKDLKKHSKNDHSKNDKLTCEICNQTFAQVQTLSRHKKIHQENQRNNLCTICGKGFHRTDDLRRHMRIHTNERPYTCTLCPKSYKQSSELTDHLKSHSTIKNYICTECGKCLATRNGLYVHMKVHRGEKNHICKVCGNKYVTTGELTSHINHIHSRAKPFVCSFDGCSRAFVTKLSLVTHTRSHTGEKPYQCLICNKYLATASSLQDHKRTHTGEKLKTCNTCGQKLGNAQALKKHLRIHSGERPYKCNVCLETFICSSSLSSHVKIKHMDKEHQCTECKKMFALPSKLRQHMKIHDKEANKNNQETVEDNYDDQKIIVDYSKTTQEYKNIQTVNQEQMKSFQHNSGLFKATSNQLFQKISFNTSDVRDCQEECKKTIQLPLEIQGDSKLISQIIPITQIAMPQMIIPHYL